MLQVKDKFNSEQIYLLESYSIELDNDTDYTDDELMNIHDKLTDAYLSNAFDRNGEPNKKAKIFEQIIDIFTMNLEFNRLAKNKAVKNL